VPASGVGASVNEVKKADDAAPSKVEELLGEDPLHSATAG
jgi:hypothetical protein